MNLLIDEDLSPRLVSVGHDHGYDTTSLRDVSKLGRKDAQILDWCIEQDRVIVTGNAGDFTALCGSVEVHPGLITLPHSSLLAQRELLEAALNYIEAHAGESGETPRDFMLNRVVEIEPDRTCSDYELPRL